MKQVKPTFFKMCGGLFSFCFLHETVFGNGQIAITHNMFVNEIAFWEWMKTKPKTMTLQTMVNEFDTITFRNGYSANAPTMVVECLGITIGKAKPKWSDNWPGNVFIIKLGKIITRINC